MTEIHLITSGSYSEYHIVGAFADKGEARSVCNHHNGPDGDNDWDSWDVETFTIAEGEQIPFTELELGCDYYPQRPAFYGPDFRETPERIHQWFPFEKHDAEECNVTLNRANNGWSLTVRGTDHERVRKVYSERKAELLAHLNGMA